MKITTLPAGVAIVFGALAMPALASAAMAQQSAMQPNDAQSGTPPAHATAPGQSPAGTGAQDTATVNTEMPGAMGAANTPPPDTRTARNRKSTPDNNNQDPNDAEARGNGQASTGADANQPARSTQTPPR